MKTKVKSRESLGNLMTQYYTGNHIAKEEGKFIIWIAIIVPRPLLLGFDVQVCVPESHSAMCAARKVGPELCETAEKTGYSMDLCSYARIDLGSVFDQSKTSPTNGLPMPDLLISNNDNCSLLVKWFDVYAREFNIPHFVLDIPFCYEPQQEKDLQYILGQFDGLIRLIEELTGQTYDIDRTREALEASNEAMSYWGEFIDLATHRPAPNTAFDTFAQMAPYICLLGNPELPGHYKLLLEETKEDMSAGRLPVPNEKYRLLWDNIAPWHQLRPMSNRLKELDANVVFSTYASSIGRIETGLAVYPWDGTDPLRYMARTQNRGWCCFGLDLRLEMLSAMVERYEIDGLVFGSNRSCKPYSIMQMDMMNRLTAKHDIPAIMIDVDHADVRKYNEENVFLRMEALLENIG